MSVNISLDHPTFTLKQRVNELSGHFMKQFGFNYFQYLRCFKDGSISLLTNNTGLTEWFKHVDNSPVVFSSYTEEHESKHSYWFLWDEELPEEPVKLARERFNICNGLTMTRRSKDYYDMIAVAMPKDPANAGSFYLNKLKAIEQFIAEFDKDNKDLIQFISKNPIALPQAYRDVNYDKICLNNGRVPVVGKFGETYITSQELSCLRLLVQGSLHKEIAHHLDISQRTVETYFTRIKQRTGLASRAELETMLTQCP